MTEESGSESEPQPSDGEAEEVVEASVDSVALAVDIPHDAPGPIAILAIIGEILGQIIGVLLCLAGVVLIFLGYSGSVTWKITDADVSSNVQTGSLGVAVLIVGLIIIVLRPPKIRVH